VNGAFELISATTCLFHLTRVIHLRAGLNDETHIHDQFQGQSQGQNQSQVDGSRNDDRTEQEQSTLVRIDDGAQQRDLSANLITYTNTKPVFSSPLSLPSHLPSSLSFASSSAPGARPDGVVHVDNFRRHPIPLWLRITMCCTALLMCVAHFSYLSHDGMHQPMHSIAFTSMANSKHSKHHQRSLAESASSSPPPPCPTHPPSPHPFLDVDIFRCVPRAAAFWMASAPGYRVA